MPWAFRLTPPTDFDTFLDMFLIRVLVGFLLVIVGLAYLFQPKTILRMNAFAREQIFKDAHVLLNARKIGTCLILVGFYLLLMTHWMPR